VTGWPSSGQAGAGDKAGGKREKPGTCRLASGVPGIDDLRPAVASLGGQVDPATARRDFQRLRRCAGADPEGNVMQLPEPLAGLRGPDRVSALPWASPPRRMPENG